MNKRKAISKKTRFDVFKRDSFLCQYCGNHPPRFILHVDHINPVSNGGSNDMDNLVTSCLDCNLGKSANLLSDIPKSLKDKAKEVEEKELQIQGYNKILKGKEERIEEEAWVIVEALECRDVDQYDRRRMSSIKKFLSLLPCAEIKEAAEITSSKYRNIGTSAFKYFCGVCWKKIKTEINI